MLTKEEFRGINKFEKFTYWFIPVGNNKYSIIDKTVYEPIGEIEYYESNINIVLEDIKHDKNIIESEWKSYVTNRPEYHVGKNSLCINDMTYEDAVDAYEHLLTGVAFIRAYKKGINPDTAFTKIYKTLEWIRSGDFYTAPASTMYHESTPSGLLYHTLKVVNKIQELKSVESFKDVNIEDAVLVALVHDWCKIGLYEMYMRNQKNAETGQWEQVAAYKRKNFLLPMGHGATSMWQASKCFNLSNQEALAIRWHQGRWNVCEAEVNEFQQANENYPLVHMLQFADQLAITKY